MNGGLIRIGAIARGTLLEAVRRKDLAVLGLFAGVLLILLASARAVGIDNPATGTLLINLTLTLIIGLAHLITLAMAGRQMPEELENRTLYPLLARPVRRVEVLLGKWSACVLVGLTVFAALVIPALLLAPRLEHYAIGTLAQLLLLQPAALGVTAALAIMLSLALPRGPAFCVAALAVFGGDGLTRLMRGLPTAHGFPNPGRMNLALRYTDGIGPLTATDIAVLLLYGILWTTLLLGAAARLFRNRSV